MPANGIEQQSDIGVDRLSMAAFPITLYFDDTQLGHATGFLWEDDDKLFLITNWHVVTGRNANTYEPLDIRTGGLPNRVCFPMQREQPSPSGDLFVPLLNGDQPLWLVHPEHGPDVDVVAVPIDEAPSRRRPAINTLPEQRLVTRVAQQLSILGYPFEPVGLPIWKQATLATEPDLAREGSYSMLVDTLSRPGMSGAPVIHRAMYEAEVETTPINPANPSEGIDSEIHKLPLPVFRFIGVYSGRLHTHSPQDIRLGIVWPRHHLMEIIAGKQLDVLPSERLADRRKDTDNK